MKRVNPKEYTRKYYLEGASGNKEYIQTFGKKLEPRLDRLVKDIKIRKGDKLLDIGCGRGELSLWAAKKGAFVLGVDYSPFAIKLAKEALEKRTDIPKNNIEFKIIDAKDIDKLKRRFNKILLIEVLEHLYPIEQKIVLKKISRLLINDGQLIIHTEPNRFFFDYAYKYWCYPVSSVLIFIWKVISGNRYPNIAHPSRIRDHYQNKMHVSEPTYFHLKKLIDDNGYCGAISTTNASWIKPEISWKDKFYNIFVFLHPLSTHFPLNIFFGCDFYAILRQEK